MDSHDVNRRDFLILTALSAFIPNAKAGAWESGSFDNDDALDRAGQRLGSKGTSLISFTPSAALADGYLETPECSAAVAAAEVVAASKGKANRAFLKELASWLKQQHKAEIAKLTPLATKAVSRILNSSESELRE